MPIKFELGKTLSYELPDEISSAHLCCDRGVENATNPFPLTGAAQHNIPSVKLLRMQ